MPVLRQTEDPWPAALGDATTGGAGTFHRVDGRWPLEAPCLLGFARRQEAARGEDLTWIEQIDGDADLATVDRRRRTAAHCEVASWRGSRLRESDGGHIGFAETGG